MRNQSKVSYSPISLFHSLVSSVRRAQIPNLFVPPPSQLPTNKKNRGGRDKKIAFRENIFDFVVVSSLVIGDHRVIQQGYILFSKRTLKIYQQFFLTGQIPSLSIEIPVRMQTMAITDSNIGTAVSSWISDSTTAAATYGNISMWDTSSVTNMENLFSFKSTFNGNIAAWNTASVTSMTGMFYCATSFNGNIAAWNTASVTSMLVLFYQASSFNGNIAAWLEHCKSHRFSTYVPCSFKLQR